MKRRIWVAVGVFLVFAILVFPQAALDVHLFLSRQPGLTLRPWDGWQALLKGGNVLKFYLFFLACWALLLFWAIMSSSYIKYKSGMIQVTPDIATPEPAGQGQYGTARWAGTKELRRYYAVAAVQNTELKELLEAGQRDYEEAENADVKIN